MQSEMERLAKDLVTFLEEYDPYEYMDAVDDPEKTTTELLNDLTEKRMRNEILRYLQSIMEEQNEWAVIAETLVERLKKL